MSILLANFRLTARWDFWRLLTDRQIVCVLILGSLSIKQMKRAYHILVLIVLIWTHLQIATDRIKKTQIECFQHVLVLTDVLRLVGGALIILKCWASYSRQTTKTYVQGPNGLRWRDDRTSLVVEKSGGWSCGFGWNLTRTKQQQVIKDIVEHSHRGLIKSFGMMLKFKADFSKLFEIGRLVMINWK